MAPRNLCLSDAVGLVLMWTQTVAACTRLTQVQARLGPSTEREGKWTWSSTTNSEAISDWYLLVKGNTIQCPGVLASRKWTLVVLLFFCYVLVNFLFCFILSFFVLWIFVFDFVFLFFSHSIHLDGSFPSRHTSQHTHTSCLLQIHGSSVSLWKRAGFPATSTKHGITRCHE